MKVLGIDPDTRNITVASLDDEGAVSFNIVASEGRRAEDRVQSLWQGFAGYLYDRMHHTDTDYVYVEKPMYSVNAGATIAQSQVIGFIRAELWREGIANSLVDPGVWKKALLGTGRASKDEIKAFAVRAWNLRDDLAQDVYDAACIAAWGKNNLKPA